MFKQTVNFVLSYLLLSQTEWKTVVNCANIALMKSNHIFRKFWILDNFLHERFGKQKNSSLTKISEKLRNQLMNSTLTLPKTN